MILVALMVIPHSDIRQWFSAAGQIYFDFGVNSTDTNYQTYENSTAGIRIKYPSGWSLLENLGNVSGNYILADFYLSGIQGSQGYSENANVIVVNRSEAVENLKKEYLDTSGSSFAIQPTKAIATEADVSAFTKYLVNETLDPIIAELSRTFGNVTLLQSIPTVISGSPGHEITYQITNDQTIAKHTQAWTFKEGNWYVVTYSAQPPAYYSPATAINIISSLVIS